MDKKKEIPLIALGNLLFAGNHLYILTDFKKLAVASSADLLLSQFSVFISLA